MSTEPIVEVSGFSPEIGLNALVKLHRRRMTATGIRTPIVLLANHSAEYLRMGLELALDARGIAAEVTDLGYNVWEAELTDPRSRLHALRPSTIVLSLTSQLLAFRDATEPESFADRLGALLRAANARLRCNLVVALPEPLEEEGEPTSWAGSWRRRLVVALRAALPSDAILVDWDPLMARLGWGRLQASRYFVAGKFMVNPQSTAALADWLARHLVALLAPRPVRLIVTDLDNTLWGGVAGEDGVDALRLGVEDGGHGFLRLQRFLLDLHAKGVLLAVCSRNNPEDALAVFERRAEMILRAEHFAEMSINWSPKSGNIDAILERLNLTAPGTVFLDDSAFERGEVRSALPELWVPELPKDPAERVGFLIATGRFTIPRCTAEDLARQQMYQVEQQRRGAQREYRSPEAYFRSLGMAMRAEPVDEHNLPRSLDLLQKTNQFNLTTRRHGRDQLLALAAAGAAWVYSLEDRGGPYGIIGLVIAVPDAESTWRLDSWLLSCRAMGRTAEHAMFRQLWTDLRRRGARRLIAEYRPTPKNQPVATLLRDLGFGPIPGRTGWFDLALDGEAPANEFVTLVGDSGSAQRTLGEGAEQSR
jgi:FkbH-like protein